MVLTSLADDPCHIRSSVDLSSDTSAPTNITVTVQVAVLSSEESFGVPLFKVAVMVTVPSFRGRTKPFASTLAIVSSLDVHLIYRISV